MNLGWWLERSFWEYPDKAAVVDADGTVVTYAEVHVAEFVPHGVE